MFMRMRSEGECKSLNRFWQIFNVLTSAPLIVSQRNTFYLFKCSDEEENLTWPSLKNLTFIHESFKINWKKIYLKIKRIAYRKLFKVAVK